MEWNDREPIYLQLREQVVQRIMDGSFAEGAAVPSVRQVAASYHINHLTVGKAYQELADLGLLEKRRGLGMFVAAGARKLLLRDAQSRFLGEELPAFAERVHLLGLEMDEVVHRLQARGGRR
ncbi:MAG: GntR family transcriptional regulator [Parahaliea sp.]